MLPELALLALASIDAAPQDLPGTTRRPARVLVYTVSAGYEHEVVHREKPEELSIVERALVDLGKRSGDFEAVVTRDAHDFTPEKLAKFDLVFFYTTGELPLSKDEREALLAFVRNGGAFAGSHCSTDTFYQVPEYGQMIGAYFDGHPWHQEVRVKVEDRENPATKHLGESFAVTDEIYQMKAPYDRSKLHVLMSLDTAALDLSGEAVHRKDRDFALAWTKEHGKGRVFYTALGHRPELWKDERFLAHLAGGFRWAMRRPEPGAGSAPEKPKEGKSEKEKEPGKGGAADPPAGAALAVPEGFAADLVAEAPEILWPSAVTCLADGSLLVGEDRMDMPGPTDQPLDRVIRLRWKAGGGFEKTEFARNLFAVMGLAEVDGDVFVMNMPHLTRLRDADGDGVAEERVEVLTDLGPPAPGFPGGFNDHIVTGLRLGMDGFLYVSVGDKGIPGAHGTDGKTIQLRGGGVVRVRPDGSDLEVVATGLRNVLDVAIDERGEMFTYDNTDDGLGWWTRLTHVVAGGYYGYPWDYHDHTDRMLPCMAEYGGGSPCGGLVYREAAWPEEYRGNLFYCEWGKSALRRFALEADGATFRVKTAEDFVRAGDVETFKPFDVCESPDGRFLYVSDWAFEGWTSPKEAGRLWRIRRADDDPRVPSAARALPKDLNGLAEQLAEPSFNTRLRAQRELSRRGTDALLTLRKVFEREIEGFPDASEQRRRRHALWAITAIGGPLRLAGLQQGLLLLGDLPAQAARAIGQTEPEGAVNLVRLWNDDNPVVRREVAFALARIGNVSEDVIAQSRNGSQDRFVRFARSNAFRRLRFLPDLRDLPGLLVFEFVASLRGVYEPEVVDRLLGATSSITRPDLAAEAISVLASLWRKPEPWDGTWWSIQPAKSPPPPHVVEWERSDAIRESVRGCLGHRHATVRRAALEALREMDDRDAAPLVRARWVPEVNEQLRASILDVLAALKDDGAKELLGSILRDPQIGAELRKRAIDTACAIRTEGMIDLLGGIVADRSIPPDHVVPCLRALGRVREPRTGDVVAGRLEDLDKDVRVAAIAALVDVWSERAATALADRLRDPSAEVRCAALQGFARLRVAASIPVLLPLVDDAATREDAILALAATPDSRALDAYLLGIGAAQRQKPVRDASTHALAAVRGDVRGPLESLHAAHRLDETQLAVIQGLYRDPQPILRWHLLGPFERAKEPKLAEGGVDLSRRFPTLDGKDTGWIDHLAEPKDGFVDLVKLLSGKANVSAYALAEVASPTACEVDMAVGSDDGVTVWVNGEPVHDFPGDRAWSPDQDRFRVKLAASARNLVLLRIVNNTGGWSFNAKIASAPVGPLFDREAIVSGLEEVRRFALDHRGDPAHGFKIFRESRDEAMCIRCHTVYGVGEKVGPDLSDIGARYGREEILASMLEPSKRIAEGYRSTSIELEDGRILFGMVQKETGEEILLHDTNGVLQTIDLKDVAERGMLDTSVMPDGLWSTMSKEDLVDLLDWLTTLRG
jgi:putative membrane-bound dehydrogenase-like protein